MPALLGRLSLPFTGLVWGIVASTALVASGCASSKKKTDGVEPPKLADYRGKKVALVGVAGEATERKVVEVALVNQLLARGTFILIPKEEIDAARAALNVDTMRPLEIARRVEADIALEARVVEFDGITREGYSKVAIDDSLLKEERGDGRDERVYKVKSLTGRVRVELSFTDVATGERKAAEAQGVDVVVAEERSRAARLPPKLRFLEKVANDAFAEFFKTY